MKGDIKDFDDTAFEPTPTISDTLVIFKGTELLIQDFGKNSGWYVGEVNGGFSVPESVSIAMVYPEIHKTNSMHAIMSGGFDMGYN